MAYGDFSRVNTNVQAFNALNQLSKTNQKLGEGQMRLSTGLRINKAEDDSAGYAIGKKLDQAVFFGVDKPVSWTSLDLHAAAVAAGQTVAIVDGANEMRVVH